MPSSGVQKCARSEEHTSELQSHDNLVCRLLLEKKTNIQKEVIKASSQEVYTHEMRRQHDATILLYSVLCPPSLCGRFFIVVFFFFFFKKKAPPQNPPPSPPPPPPRS